MLIKRPNNNNRKEQEEKRLKGKNEEIHPLQGSKVRVL